METKLDIIHAQLDGAGDVTLQSFEELSRNLLFFTTLQKSPIRCHFDLHVQKTFKGIDATDVDFWNMTPAQNSILTSDNPCVLFTSKFSTGKTMLIAAKAKQVAKKYPVLFIISKKICGR